jgi:HSP20 family protein
MALPVGEMRRLQKEMDELFGSFFEHGEGGRELMGLGFRAPLSDIEDRGDEIVVASELPGVRKEDLRITPDEDPVTISAERKEAADEKKKNYYYCERSYSGFRRSFALPAGIDPDSAEAEYKDGASCISG